MLQSGYALDKPALLFVLHHLTALETVMPEDAGAVIQALEWFERSRVVRRCAAPRVFPLLQGLLIFAGRSFAARA